jgi:RNAse (barnase) inhibitor barstar
MMAERIRQIDLDAKTWCTSEDVYAALLEALEAPAWHGHNLNALQDSIVTGSINKVEPPFSITISNSQMAAGEAQEFLRILVELFQDFAEKGCPVSFVLR